MRKSLNKVKVGVVGCGKVAVVRHLPVLARMKRCEVKAIADVDPKRLEAVKNKFRIGRTYASHTELLRDADVDAVAVCVPLPSHAEVALDAVAAGKHVLLEKPLAMTLDEADRLVERTAHSDRKVMVGYNKRWHRLVRKTREIIKNGSLGEVRMIQVVFSTGHRNRYIPQWRLHRKDGGGSIIENGSHFYDLWRFLLGKNIRKVSALSRSTGNSDDEPSVVTGETENGVFLNCVLSDFLPDRFEMEIFGEDCVLHASLHRFDGLEFIPLRSYAGEMKSRLKRTAGFFKALPAGMSQARRGGDYNASFEDMWDHFIDCIIHDMPVGCTLEDGRKALQIALAALESVSTGKTVYVADAPRSITLPS
ncbi:MAG: Gfo/Idh/MocA family oxidoreductase [Candidatus Aminicenantes bacterium]|jgi:predicted dehydrogenase